MTLSVKGDIEAKSETPARHAFADLQSGMVVRTVFSVTVEDMETFARLSGDRSRIHHDVAYAKRNGFDGPVVYGALTVAQLSYLVGMHLPGDFGLATSWVIHFGKPLYVGEEAVMTAELVHLSPSTRLASLKFNVRVGERLVASGTASSMLLQP
jgi:acyl dehydratase